jgi:hypothetical protein
LEFIEMRRQGLILICLLSVAFGLPKRPTRPKGRAASNIDKENDEAFEIPQVTKEIENEQEIGSFPWYEDSEDETIDDEPVEFLEAEGRKRPKRPTNINFNPFDDPLDFVPSFQPTNKYPIFIERNKEVIEDVMDEEIDENEEDDNIDENGLETMPFEIIERNRKDDYEIREYGASKWVCTDEIKNVDEDPYENWRERFDNDGRKAMMQTNREEKRKDKKGMFMKLFKYIIGVNSEATEIDMTTPVTTKRTKMADNKEKHQMCFWTGSEWADKELPEPIKEDVYFETREAMQVFVKKFSGYALSMEEWNDKMEELSNEIEDREDVETPETHYTISYSSPFVEENKRRNEVWIVRDPSKAKKPVFGGSPFTSGSLPSKFTNADELTELLEHNTIEKGDGYEVRVYPSSKWVCTKEYDVDPINDPMNDWQENFNNNPFLAMSSSDWKDTPSSKMFKTLYKYLIGLNEDNKEIEMTRPVINKMIPQRRTRKYDEEMCFWLGLDYDRREAPRPSDRKVNIKELDEMTFYVRQFGGFSLSHEDIAKEYNQLKFDLRGKLYDDTIFYSVGYNSPFTMENRRNEIWIQAV